MDEGKVTCGGEFAANLRAIRAMRDMSQEELAKAVGVSAASVNNWESGDYMPSLRTTIRLANALKCDLNVLAGRVGLLDGH